MIRFDPKMFPRHGSPAEQLAFAARWATLAPSSHNSQPWQFVVARDRLYLKADRSRRLPVVDPDDRELAISCGAALFHLRVALRWFGFVVGFELNPDCFDSDVLAIVRIVGIHERNSDDERLFAAIPRRHTNRSRFTDGVPPSALPQRLVAAAREHGAWIDFTSGMTKEAVASLIAEGDHIQSADHAFRRELASWLRPNGDGIVDGMPGYTRDLSNAASHLAPLVVRTFESAAGRAAYDHELAVGSPLLAVVGSDGDRECDWVETGQALGHVLLLATSENVAASFLNQPVEVPVLRARLREVIGKSGHPQLVLRMGNATKKVFATPRRPTGDVIRMAAAEHGGLPARA